jgi:hypothetical protein
LVNLRNLKVVFAVAIIAIIALSSVLLYTNYYLITSKNSDDSKSLANNPNAGLNTSTVIPNSTSSNIVTPQSNPTANPTPTPTSMPTTNGSTQDYWTLNILPTTGTNIVTPNGTIEIPMGQSGITVTATPDSQCGFIDWMLDYKVIGNSPTVFIPTQQEGSNHTLEAYFAHETPIISPAP